MHKRSKSDNAPQFYIQLLSDKCVVLVEALGYESEIFLPHLQKGRIALMNVIPSRQQNEPMGQDSQCNLARVGASFKLTTATAGLAPTMWTTPRGQPSRFALKLISNGNVVLAECNGYESEIFLPFICNRCVAMKRVTVKELVMCSHFNSNEQNREAVEAPDQSQASKVLVNPMQFLGMSSVEAKAKPLKKRQQRHLQNQLTPSGAGDQRNFSKFV